MEDKLTFNLTNEKGETFECEVLFTFNSDENGKDYMVYTDNSLDEYGNVRVYASTYTTDETGNISLEAITDENEWKMIDDLIAAIQEEESEGCDCGCHECADGCDCGDDCNCGDDCHCGTECTCGDECNCTEEDHCGCKGE